MRGEQFADRPRKSSTEANIASMGFIGRDAKPIESHDFDPFRGTSKIAAVYGGDLNFTTSTSNSVKRVVKK
jgi:hypothetical protein